MDIKNWLEKSIIFECIAGSHAYGLNTPESDTDYRGICIPPIDYWFGLFSFEQHEAKAPNDRVIFNIIKFLNLAVDNNPNIIELFFMPDDCIVLTTKSWDKLAEHRNEFLSKKVRHSYGGYAFSQIKRVKTHREWLLNPPTHQPTREEFGLPQHQKMSADYMGAIESLMKLEFGIHQNDIDADKDLVLKNVPSDFIPADIMGLYEKERAYRNAKKRWEQYQNWVKTRNPKRADLERKFGYDTKHMSHTFRLLIQGEEILSKGTLSTRLSKENQEFCRAIKLGAYSYDELIEKADTLMGERFDSLYLTSTLPSSVDMKKVSDLAIEIVEEYLNLSK
jgi:uncharacterized protein